MKIAVISDTHGVVSAWERALKAFDGAEIILHAGDVLYHPPRIGFTSGYEIPALAQLMNNCPIPILIARGNCDAQVYEELLDMPVLSPYAVAEIGGLRIVITHGHTLAAENLRDTAARYGADVLVTGHTHVPVIERLGDSIHLNPGSPSHPKLQIADRLIPTAALIDEGIIRVLDLDTRDTLMSQSIR